MTIVLRFLSIKKSQSIIRISKTRKYDDFFNVESVDRIINYPKSSRKSEIEKNGYFWRKSGHFGQYWYSMEHSEKIPAVWILKFCLRGRSLLEQYFEFLEANSPFEEPHEVRIADVWTQPSLRWFPFTSSVVVSGEVTDEGLDLKIILVVEIFKIFKILNRG